MQLERTSLFSSADPAKWWRLSRLSVLPLILWRVRTFTALCGTQHQRLLARIVPGVHSRGPGSHGSQRFQSDARVDHRGREGWSYSQCSVPQRRRHGRVRRTRWDGCSEQHHSCSQSVSFQTCWYWVDWIQRTQSQEAEGGELVGMNQHSSTDSRNLCSPFLLVQVTISLQATQCDACVSGARSIFASDFALNSLSLHQRYSLHTRLVFAVFAKLFLHALLAVPLSVNFLWRTSTTLRYWSDRTQAYPIRSRYSRVRVCNSQTTAVWLSDWTWHFTKRDDHIPEKDSVFDFVKHHTWIDLFFFLGCQVFNAKGCCGQGEEQARERLARDFKKDDVHRRSGSVGPQGWPNNLLRISHRPVKRPEHSKHHQTHRRKSGGQEHGASPRHATNRRRTRKGPEIACFNYGQWKRANERPAVVTCCPRLQMATVKDSASDRSHDLLDFGYASGASSSRIRMSGRNHTFSSFEFQILVQSEKPRKDESGRLNHRLVVATLHADDSPQELRLPDIANIFKAMVTPATKQSDRFRAGTKEHSPGVAIDSVTSSVVSWRRPLHVHSGQSERFRAASVLALGCCYWKVTRLKLAGQAVCTEHEGSASNVGATRFLDTNPWLHQCQATCRRDRFHSSTGDGSTQTSQSAQKRIPTSMDTTAIASQMKVLE